MSSPRKRFVDFVLGTHPKLRSRVRMGLLSSIIYVCICAANVLSACIGWITWSDAGLLIAHNCIGIFVFYPWVRLGLTENLQDSGLIQPQIMYAASSAVLCYTLNPKLGNALLPLLCFIHLFGLFTLRPRQLLLTGGFTVALLLGTLALTRYWHRADAQFGIEAMRIVFTCFAISLITWMSMRHSRSRGRLSQQKLELAQAVSKINDLVKRDSLTHLFNRKHMQELLEVERLRHQRTGRSFCVALVDLDHFKSINDQFGHAAGDEVLRCMASTANATLRKTDIIGRWGGEEFLILMPETPHENDAFESIERLRKKVSNALPIPNEPQLRFSFSAGIASHVDGEDVPKMIDRADRALYRAKHAGRNCSMTSLVPAARCVGSTI